MIISPEFFSIFPKFGFFGVLVGGGAGEEDNKLPKITNFSPSCSQRSNFSPKAVGKIIAEAETKKNIYRGSASAIFCRRNRTNLYLPWQFPRQSWEVTSAMLFYLINYYKIIINCSAKPMNNSK